MTHEVFISYDKADSATADAVVTAFEDNGLRCWIAPRDIGPDDGWANAITEAIRASSLVVLLVSTSSNVRRETFREVEHAVLHEVPVYWIGLDGAEPTSTLGYYLGALGGGALSTHPTGEQLQALIESVSGMLPGRNPRVVFSCPKQDARIALQALAALEARSIPCWYAPRDLDLAEPDAEARIERAIEGCETLAVIVSDGTPRSHQIGREVQCAVDAGKRIVAIRLDAAARRPAGSGASRSWWDHLLAAPSIDARHLPLTDTIERFLELLESEPARPPLLPARGEGGFDVFISYRRGNGAEVARLMQLELRERGVAAFLDVDDLRPGHFDEALLAEIERAPAFLLVLSPKALDRCSAADDWLRREISHALAVGRTVVPVLMPSFEFPPPEDLPEEIRPILVHHGVNYSHEFLGAVVDKIVGYLER